MYKQIAWKETFDQRKHSEGKYSSENIKKGTDKKSNNQHCVSLLVEMSTSTGVLESIKCIEGAAQFYFTKNVSPIRK